MFVVYSRLVGRSVGVAKVSSSPSFIMCFAITPLVKSGGDICRSTIALPLTSLNKVCKCIYWRANNNLNGSPCKSVEPSSEGRPTMPQVLQQDMANKLIDVYIPLGKRLVHERKKTFQSGHHSTIPQMIL